MRVGTAHPPASHWRTLRAVRMASPSCSPGCLRSQPAQITRPSPRHSPPHPPTAPKTPCRQSHEQPRSRRGVCSCRCSRARTLVRAYSTSGGSRCRDTVAMKRGRPIQGLLLSAPGSSTSAATIRIPSSGTGAPRPRHRRAARRTPRRRSGLRRWAFAVRSAREVRRLDDENYHGRGMRLIAGRLPLATGDMGAPLTAEGSHWT